MADDLFAPLVDYTLACLQAAVLAHPYPPGIVCVRAGDHVSPGVSTTENECCTGLAWVRFDTALPTDAQSFPNATSQIQHCTHEWAVALEVGIARCAPTGTGHTLPTCGDWTLLKTQAAADMKAIREVACCVQNAPDYAYWDLVLGAFKPEGPEGACSQTTADVTVKVIGCDADCVTV